MIRYNPNTSMISNEEKEHIIKELISKRMAEDLAMFFLTQEYIQIEEIFSFGCLIEDDFYKRVFTKLFNVLRFELEKDANTDMLYNIISRMRFSHFIPSTVNLVGQDRQHFIQQHFQSELLETIIFFLTELRMDDTLSQAMTLIHSNGNIPGKFIINTIIKDKRYDIKYSLIGYAIINDMISIEDFIDIFHLLKSKYDDEFLNSIIYDITADRDSIYMIMKIIYDRYVVVFNNNNAVLHYMGDSDKEVYEGLEYLRKFIKDIITTDVERDFFFEFLEPGRNRFIGCGDKFRALSYDKLFNWYAENIDKTTFKDNFFKQKYVDIGETFPLSLDECLIMVSDINTLNYIVSYESLPLYESMIRLINLSRFDFFQLRRKRGIESMIFNSMDEYRLDMVKTCSTSELIAFILYL